EPRQVRDGIERARIQAIGKGVVEQPRSQILRAHFVVTFQPELLDRAKVVGIAELLTQGFVQVPVRLRRLRAEQFRDVRVEIRLHLVVVEQRVVDIEQEHQGRGCVHSLPFVAGSTLGSFQPPASAISASACFGPQVPGLYLCTGTLSPMIGSSTRHASSTQSSRVNSAESPSIASPSSRSYGIMPVRMWRCATSSTG